MKILLVDDNPMFLVGLQNLLEAADHQVVGVANCAERALAIIRHLIPDVILMDVMMPGRSGIEAAAQIKQNFPSIKVVMMTVSESDAHLYEAIKAGASGYLLKSLTMEEFPAALEKLVHGDAPITPGLLPKILGEFASLAKSMTKALPAQNPLSNRLSLRDRTILKHLAAGATYKEVAELTNLSERTIKYEIRAMADQFNLKNKTQLMAFASKFLPEL